MVSRWADRFVGYFQAWGIWVGLDWLNIYEEDYTLYPFPNFSMCNYLTMLNIGPQEWCYSFYFVICKIRQLSPQDKCPWSLPIHCRRLRMWYTLPIALSIENLVQTYFSNYVTMNEQTTHSDWPITVLVTYQLVSKLVSTTGFIEILCSVLFYIKSEW